MSTKIFSFFVLVILLSCSQKLGLGTWTKIESSDQSVPVERHEAAFVGIGDKFYLLGGRGIRPASIYDTKTKTWSKGSPPPVEIHHFQPVVYDNKAYLLGAMTGGYPSETPLPNIIIYDPATDSWETGPEIPEDRRRGGAGAVLYKDKIYMACGIKNGHIGDHKNWLDCYDLKENKWTILPDAPRPRDHFQAVVAKDKLYLLGGRTTKAEDNPFKNTIGEVDVFDFESNEWTTLPINLPTLRAGNSALYYKGEVLVIGGESFTQKPAHSEVEALNIKTHQWRSLSPLLQGRHGTAPVIYDGKIFLASGCGNRGGEPELQTMECFSYKK